MRFLLLTLLGLLLVQQHSEAQHPCNDINGGQTACDLSAEQCFYLPEDGTCNPSGFCKPDWPESTCHSLANNGSCAHNGTHCEARETPLPVLNVGRKCGFGCGFAAVGVLGGCDFCGSQGVCCDSVNGDCVVPGGCDDFCCAPYVPPTPEPSAVPTSSPQTACEQESHPLFCALAGCLYLADETRCVDVGYCDPAWDQATCTLAVNNGTCEYLNDQCVQKETFDPVINLGRECKFECSSYALPGLCPSFCGTEGHCCEDGDPGCIPSCETGLCCSEPFTSDAPTSNPTVSAPSVSPSYSMPSMSPSNAPIIAPSVAPTVRVPSIAPTAQDATSAPTIFGSVVFLRSLTGGFNADVHAKEDFQLHACEKITEYWYPSSTGCDTDLITLTISEHIGVRLRLLDEGTPLPNIDIKYQCAGLPLNTTALALGFEHSDVELSKRIAQGTASSDFLISPYEETATATSAPAEESTNVAATSTETWIGIGVGIFFFILLIVLILVCRSRRRKREEEERNNKPVSGRDLAYRAKEGAYRSRQNIYVPPTQNVVFSKGREFQSHPSSRDFVAEEVRGGAFAVTAPDDMDELDDDHFQVPRQQNYRRGQQPPSYAQNRALGSRRQVQNRQLEERRRKSAYSVKSTGEKSLWSDSGSSRSSRSLRSRDERYSVHSGHKHHGNSQRSHSYGGTRKPGYNRRDDYDEEEEDDEEEEFDMDDEDDEEDGYFSSPAVRPQRTPSKPRTAVQAPPPSNKATPGSFRDQRNASNAGGPPARLDRRASQKEEMAMYFGASPAAIGSRQQIQTQTSFSLDEPMTPARFKQLSPAEQEQYKRDFEKKFYQRQQQQQQQRTANVEEGSSPYANPQLRSVVGRGGRRPAGEDQESTMSDWM